MNLYRDRPTACLSSLPLRSTAALPKVRQLPRRWLSLALAPASLFNAAVAVFLDCLVSASHACVGMTLRGRCPLNFCGVALADDLLLLVGIHRIGLCFHRRS